MTVNIGFVSLRKASTIETINNDELSKKLNPWIVVQMNYQK